VVIELALGLCNLACTHDTEVAAYIMDRLFCNGVFPAELPAAAFLAFQPGTGALVSVATDGIVRLVDLPGGGDDAGGAAPGAVVAIRELHDLRYKMWYKRDRARSAARRAAPAVALAALSPDGLWLAASVHGRVQLLGLASHRVVAQLAPAAEHSPLAALAFTADAAAVVAVAACNRVAAFSVPGGQPTEWTQRHAGSLPHRLLDLPGPVAGVAGSPAGAAAVLLFSPHAVCHVDMSKAPGQEAAGGRKRRARGAAAASPPGLNCRALYCADPVLLVQPVGRGEVLVVERAWEEVWRGLPPPLYRHRYGT
jgi:U3 small nucleolar RNA-associated protein 4